MHLILSSEEVYKCCRVAEKAAVYCSRSPGGAVTLGRAVDAVLRQAADWDVAEEEECAWHLPKSSLAQRQGPAEMR